MSNIIRRTVTIANSGTVSTEAQLDDGTLVGVITDSGLEAGNLTFSASDISGGTFVDVYDASNTQIAITTATASRYYSLADGGIRGFEWLKLTSATTQTGETTLTLVILQSNTR